MEQENDRRAVESAAPVARPWRRAIKQLGQGLAAAALLVAGVVFTLEQEHPALARPAAGVTLPAAIVNAPTFADQAVRIAAMLRPYAKDPTIVGRIAGAIVHEGERRKIDPTLLVGVLLTEDATLDTTARSVAGARGLMQVMPGHAGKWGCGSSNLLSVESNICHGASILQDNIRNSPNTRVALLKYNGCAGARSSPKCWGYPDKVLRNKSRALTEVASSVE